MKKYIAPLLILILLLAGGLFLKVRGPEKTQNNEEPTKQKSQEKALKFPTEFLLEKSEIKKKTIEGEVVGKEQVNILTVKVDLREIFTDPPKAFYEKELKVLSDTFIYKVEGEKPISLSAEDINVGDKISARFFGDAYMIFEDIVFEAWKIQVFKPSN